VHERCKTERRKTDRSRVLKSVKLVLEKSMMIDCVVRNLTNIGARFHIQNTVELPEALGHPARLLLAAIWSRVCP
jgi:hypothetical protein